MHLGKFGIKFGATVGQYTHMSILYSPCSPKSILHNHTSIAHRFLSHKETRPQQHQLQSLLAASFESTIAYCPLPTVYCHQPAAHPLLFIAYGPLPGPAECAERLNNPKRGGLAVKSIGTYTDSCRGQSNLSEHNRKS